MFGCPYDQDVPWDDRHIRLTSAGETLGLSAAVAAGWVYPAIYRIWDSKLTCIDPVRRPGALQPWRV